MKTSLVCCGSPARASLRRPRRRRSSASMSLAGAPRQRRKHDEGPNPRGERRVLSGSRLLRQRKTTRALATSLNIPATSMSIIHRDQDHPGFSLSPSKVRDQRTEQNDQSATQAGDADVACHQTRNVNALGHRAIDRIGPAMGPYFIANRARSTSLQLRNPATKGRAHSTSRERSYGRR